MLPVSAVRSRIWTHAARRAKRAGVPALDFMRSFIAMGYRLELDPDGAGGGGEVDPAEVEVPGIEAPLTIFFSTD